MSDYSVTTDFSVKDGLSPGDPEKIISGADVDVEFNAISTAIATKYDTDDLATELEAEALTLNTKLLTPLRLDNVFKDNDGLVSHLQAISGLGTGGDKIMFFDDTDDTLKALSIGNGIEISGTTLQLPSSLGGTGLTLTSGVLDVDIGSSVQAWDANLDQIAALAVTDGNFIVGNGSAWVAESGATARTSLGLGSLATASTISNSDWSGADLAVANGGTGASDAATAATNLGLGTGNNVTHANITATGTLGATGAFTASSTATFNGNVTCNESFTPVDEIFMGGKIEDDVGAATSINNYAPTGYLTCNWISVISSNVTALTGLAGGTDGRLILITNPYANSSNLNFTADDAASTAGNRFATSASLAPGEGTWVVYDGTDSRWIVMGKA